jgi:hypothetical protein
VVPKGDPSGRNWTKFSIDFPGNCVWFIKTVIKRDVTG